MRICSGAYRAALQLWYCIYPEYIYGTSGMAPLMIIASVPIYNVMAVGTGFSETGEERLDGTLIKKILKGLQPIRLFLESLQGRIWSGCKLPCPPILIKTVDNLGKSGNSTGIDGDGRCVRCKKAFERSNRRLLLRY